MKITKSQLKEIIKEELEAVLDEGLWSDVKAGLGIGDELEKRLAANPNYGSSKAEIRRQKEPALVRNLHAQWSNAKNVDGEKRAIEALQDLELTNPDAIERRDQLVRDLPSLGKQRHAE